MQIYEMKCVSSDTHATRVSIKCSINFDKIMTGTVQPTSSKTNRPNVEQHSKYSHLLSERCRDPWISKPISKMFIMRSD